MRTLPKAPARVFKPSQFNVAGRVADGTLVASNSYSGGALVFDRSETRRAQALLADGATAVPTDDVGKALVEFGFLVPVAASEPARLNELHDALNDTSTLQLVVLAGRGAQLARTETTCPDVAMSRPVRRALKALVVNSMQRLRALRLSWMNADTGDALGVACDTTAFASRLADEKGVTFSSDAVLDASAIRPEEVRALVESGVRRLRLVVDTRGGAGYGRTTQGTALLRDLLSTGEDAEYIVRYLVDDATADDLAGITREVDADARFTFEIAGRSLAEEWAGCVSTRVIAPAVAVCHAAKRNSLVIGPTGTLHKCTYAFDDPRNDVGRLTAAGDLEFYPDRYALWTGLDYRSDSVCGACFYAPSCMGSACPLARIRDGARPCPEAKRDVAQSLEGIYARA